MVDIAESAKVSVATVSRVLSGTGLDAVRPETADAVREAAERLGYRYNAVAAALRTQHTKMLGVVVPRIANPYFSILVEALERQLSSTDVELIIADSREDTDLERERIAALVDRRVDGLIVIPATSDLSMDAIRQSGVPTVQLGLRDAGPAVDRVGVDHVSGVAVLIEHLRQRGHKRFAFIGADPVRSPLLGRLRGFEEAVAESERADVLLDAYSMEWGYEAGGMLGRSDGAATAVVCANDLIAYGLLKWAHEQSIRIPAEIAVTGFDDLPFSSGCLPPLTTIRQPIKDLAEAAIDLVLSRIAGDATDARETRLAGELVVREST